MMLLLLRSALPAPMGTPCSAVLCRALETDIGSYGRSSSGFQFKSTHCASFVQKPLRKSFALKKNLFPERLRRYIDFT